MFFHKKKKCEWQHKHWDIFSSVVLKHSTALEERNTNSTVTVGTWACRLNNISSMKMGSYKRCNTLLKTYLVHILQYIFKHLFLPPQWLNYELTWLIIFKVLGFRVGVRKDTVFRKYYWIIKNTYHFIILYSTVYHLSCQISALVVTLLFFFVQYSVSILSCCKLLIIMVNNQYDVF